MNLRRARLSVFGTTLFSDPAWDILLELYTLKLTGRGAPITGLAHIASPLTLARWLQILEDKGLIFSWDDRSTAGQPGVCLSATGATNMFAVLTELV
jgi:hypothetical protein